MLGHILKQTVVVAALLGMLGACESAPEGSTAGAEAAAAPAADTAVGAAADGSESQAAPAIETGAAPPPTAVAALTVAPAEPAEPAIDDDPQQLYGLDSGALGELLGEPSLVRKEAPAEIWQYRSQTCVFDVFLYEGADRPRVSYIEARDDAAQRIDARACLNEILRARKGLEPLG